VINDRLMHQQFSLSGNVSQTVKPGQKENEYDNFTNTGNIRWSADK
jgi:hypothetical protein